MDPRSNLPWPTIIRSWRPQWGAPLNLSSWSLALGPLATRGEEMLCAIPILLNAHFHFSESQPHEADSEDDEEDERDRR